MRGFAVGVGAAAVAAAVALVSGCAPRPLALPRSAKAPMLYVALGDSTVEGIGASSRRDVRRADPRPATRRLSARRRDQPRRGRGYLRRRRRRPARSRHRHAAQSGDRVDRAERHHGTRAGGGVRAQRRDDLPAPHRRDQCGRRRQPAPRPRGDAALPRQGDGAGRRAADGRVQCGAGASGPSLRCGGRRSLRDRAGSRSRAGRSCWPPTATTRPTWATRGGRSCSGRASNGTSWYAERPGE